LVRVASLARATRDEIVDLARRTPLARGAVQELGARIDLDRAEEVAREILVREGAHVAQVLAFALAGAGRKLAPEVVRALLPELDDLDLTGPLLSAVDGDPTAVVVAMFDDRAAMLEHEALCVLLAAEALAGAPPPPKLLVHARYLARHDVDSEARICLGAAAMRLGDPSYSALVATFVASAKRNKKLVEEILGKARRAPLEALPEIGAHSVQAGYTVRRAKEVGRNDPCPCGSGQKFKKCCAGKPDKAAADDGFDAASVTPEQARAFKPSDLARLDAARVSSDTLVELVRRAIGLRRFAEVEAMLAIVTERKELAAERERLAILALSAAFEAHDREAAERFLARVPEGRVDASVEMALLRGEPDVLARIDRACESALRDEADGTAMIDLGYMMLRHAPALGILVARGAVHEGHPKDSTMLLEQVEDARDRLLLSPFEPWWDVFESMVERPEPTGKAGEEEKKLASELRRARAQSRKASSEVAQLRARLEELDAQLGSSKPKPQDKAEKRRAGSGAAPLAPTVAAAPDAALEEERRRLRGKVEELQRIIGEGQEERRELRRQLEEMVEVQPKEASGRGEAEEADEDEAYEDADVDDPRRVLVPVFSDRAAKALADLAAPAADVVLSVVAGLASSRENAWGGVKRLEKARTVHSARAGIHYRVLFTVDDGVLTVREVVHRRDLEQAVNRAVRLG
jgi:mRNA-degrading endonuclease RelE of RelBE toxin-antitoxin system